MDLLRKSLGPFDIAALQETRWPGIGDRWVQIRDGSRYRVIWSGGKSPNNGVAIVLSKEYGNMVVEKHHVSDRICAITLESENDKTKIISCYAPATNNTSARELEFLNHLEEVSSTLRGRKHQKVIVCGDFNARIGCAKAADEKEPLSLGAGPHGFGETNTRGYELMRWAIEEELFICNTWTQNAGDQKWTWRMRSQDSRSLIDYVMISFHMVVDGCFIEDAGTTLLNSFANSDHHPVQQKLKLFGKNPTNSPKKPKAQRGVQYDYAALSNKELSEKYSERTSQPLIEGNGDPSTEDLWTNIKNCLEKAARDTLPQLKTNPSLKHKASSGKLKALIVEKRSLLKKGWHHLNDTERKHVNFIGKEIAKTLKEDMETYIETLCTTVDQSLNLNDSRTLHAATKLLARGQTVNPKPLIPPDTMQSHFKKVLNPTTAVNQVERESLISQIKDRLATLDPPQISKEAPSVDEVRTAIRALKTGKAIGPDRVPAELFQNCSDVLATKITSLIERIWNGDEIPKDLLITEIVALYKGKGERSSPDSYRGICIQNHITKLLSEIIRQRLNCLVDFQVGEYQTGFRQGRGTQDALFTFRLMLQNSSTAGQPIYSCFIDLVKAFDTCEWSIIFETLEGLNVPKNIISVIKKLYTNTVYSVKGTEDNTEPFGGCAGVKQGCVLSPSLFILTLDIILRVALEGKTDRKDMLAIISYILGYADDLAITEATMEELKETLESIDETISKANMNISTEKTKILTTDKDCKSKETVIRNHTFAHVQEFNYLGSMVDQSGTDKIAIQNQIRKASTTFGSMKDIWSANISPKAKLTTYRSIVRPRVMYSSETLYTTTETNHDLDVFERNCLRKILWIKWREHVENKELYERVTQIMGN